MYINYETSKKLNSEIIHSIEIITETTGSNLQDREYKPYPAKLFYIQMTNK